MTYGGTVPSLSGTVTGFVNGDTLSSATTGTASFSTTAGSTSNAGSYAIDGSGLTAGNYTFVQASGNASALTITKAPLTVTVNSASKSYDGTASSGGFGASYSGWVAGDGSSLSVLGGTLTYGGTSQGAVNAGSYTITGSGYTSSNYAISYVPGTLTINTVPLTVTANNDSKTYDGQAYSGGNGVSYAGFVNGETSSVLGGTLSYSGTSQGAVNAGSYVITPSGLTSGNYSITFTKGTLTVSPAPLTVTANNDSKTYDGLAYSGGNGVTYSGFVNSESASVLGGTLAYGGTSQGAVNANSYAIIPSGLTSGNYSITFANGTLTVNPAPLTVTANNDSKTYDGLAYSGGNGVTYAGFVNGETSAVLGGTISYNGTSQGAINAGSYLITPTGLTSSNYSISYADGSLTVNPALLTVTANNDSKTYDGLAYSGGNGVTYSGFVNSESASVLGGTLTYGGTSQGAVDLGSYSIIPAGLTGNNYSLSYVGGTLDILSFGEPKALQLAVTQIESRLSTPPPGSQPQGGGSGTGTGTGTSNVNGTGTNNTNPGGRGNGNGSGYSGSANQPVVTAFMNIGESSSTLKIINGGTRLPPGSLVLPFGRRHHRR